MKVSHNVEFFEFWILCKDNFLGQDRVDSDRTRIGTNLKTATDFFGTYPRKLIQKEAKEKILFFNRPLVLEFFVVRILVH